MQFLIMFTSFYFRGTGTNCPGVCEKTVVLMPVLVYDDFDNQVLDYVNTPVSCVCKKIQRTSVWNLKDANSRTLLAAKTRTQTHCVIFILISLDFKYNCECEFTSAWTCSQWKYVTLKARSRDWCQYYITT